MSVEDLPDRLWAELPNVNKESTSQRGWIKKGW